MIGKTKEEVDASFVSVAAVSFSDKFSKKAFDESFSDVIEDLNDAYEASPHENSTSKVAP